MPKNSRVKSDNDLISVSLEGKADDTRETCHRKPSGISPFEPFEPFDPFEPFEPFDPFEPVDPEPRSLKAGIRDE